MKRVKKPKKPIEDRPARSPYELVTRTNYVNLAILETVDEELPQEEIDERKSRGMGDYWIPTKENAIRPLYKLIELAKMRPDGIWEGD